MKPDKDTGSVCVLGPGVRCLVQVVSGGRTHKGPFEQGLKEVRVQAIWASRSKSSTQNGTDAALRWDCALQG